MKDNKYLEQLKQTDSIPNLIDKIKEIFKGFKDNDYIPAIIEEGNFTAERGEDLYIKLVLKHHSIRLEKTWLKDNLSFELEEPTEFDNKINVRAFIHNVITERKYKTRNLYQLNPLLVSDEINEYEYTSSEYVNAFYNDEYSNVKGLPVLKSTKDHKLLILKKVFKYYLNDPKENVYPKFELVAEFEYRTHKNHFFNTSTETYKTNDACVEVNSNNNSIYVLGSIRIPLLQGKELKGNRRIKVIDLGDFKPREHNFSHYNGDTIEGFVCFKSKVIDVLKNYYYFYDLQMIDKSNIQNTYLVDVLEDKVVFWEAEYNKLPISIKDKIDSLNFVPKEKKGIISSAMAAMQLEADWNWDKKLTPELMLANLIREKSFKRAIDIGVSFIEPKSVKDLSGFIIKIEKLTGIKLERFNTKTEDVERLINIRQGNKLTQRIDNLKTLYQKYCYAVHMEYKK
ncbi:hypothetical protein [Peribacillus sp. SCS-37]|uniref:hypothetical protein n=1 Tax=Paraperibacillus esterisolvens TaxID=3115296 RepID=UPI0039059920